MRGFRGLHTELRVGWVTGLLLSVAQVCIAPALARTDPPPAPAGYVADVELWHPVIGKGIAEILLIGKTVYVKPLDVFSFAHIMAADTSDGSVVTGFYIDKTRPFTISPENRSITYEGKRITLDKDAFAVRSGEWFMETAVLEKVFGLKCTFNMPLMRMVISAPEPLPAEREQREAEELRHVKGLEVASKLIPDIAIPLPRNLFSLGTLDWSFTGQYANPAIDGNYSLQLGSQFLGGDLDGTLLGYTHQRVDWNDIPWRWRYPIQNSSLVSTVLVGRRAAFSGLALADSMIGLQVTNIRPSSYTSADANYTTYTISDRTQPDWTVELYINDQLVSFTKADAMGFYKFAIPIPYGSTDIRLRFVGPYGEVQTKDVSFRIPYTFLPPGTVGYTLTVGTPFNVPTLDNAVGKMDLQFGVNSTMTFGGGLRYSRLPGNVPDFVAFANGSLRLSKDAIASAEYYHGIGLQSRLDISDLFGLTLGAGYDQAFSNQRTLLDDLTVQDSRSLRLSGPFPANLGSFQVEALDYPFTPTEGNFLLNGYTAINLWQCVLNATANASFIRNQFRLLQPSDFLGSLSFTVPAILGTSIRPQVDGDYTTGTVTDFGITLSRSVFNFASVSLTWIHYIAQKMNSLQASLGVIFPFASMGISGSSATSTAAQYGASSQGSLVCDPSSGRFFAENRPEVRYGGFTVEPFLDRNNDGKREQDEPLVKNVTLDGAPGNVITHKDGSMQLLGVEPYTPYCIKTGTTKLDVASLVPKYSSFEVTPPANGFAHVELPIVSMGQIEGYITRMNGKDSAPLSGARIKIQHADANDTSLVVPNEDLLTYSNGEYYYLGLLPGKYRVYVDPMQLELLHAVSSPPFIEITVTNKDDGDYIDNVNFTITKRQGSTKSGD